MAAVDPAAARLALGANPGLPADLKGPVFHEPWHAQVFAMTLALYEKRLFVWPEWAAMLGETIKVAQADGDPDTGDT
ncbi:MAG: nitrile hydratase accessory protein, partial [Acetobacteraceae bacterium]|nr:nitrile hydratase accessory protein [Acetobacteraceae bacterium]